MGHKLLRLGPLSGFYTFEDFNNVAQTLSCELRFYTRVRSSIVELATLVTVASWTLNLSGIQFNLRWICMFFCSVTFSLLNLIVYHLGNVSNAFSQCITLWLKLALSSSPCVIIGVYSLAYFKMDLMQLCLVAAALFGSSLILQLRDGPFERTKFPTTDQFVSLLYIAVLLQHYLLFFPLVPSIAQQCHARVHVLIFTSRSIEVSKQFTVFSEINPIGVFCNLNLSTVISCSCSR